MSKHKFDTRSLLATGAIALCGLAISAPVMAQAPSESAPGARTVSIKIDYSDLNLTGSRARSTLRNRVWDSVHRMCRGDDFGYQPSLQDVKCRTSAWTQAKPQIERALQQARGLAAAGPAPNAIAIDYPVGQSR